MRINAAVPGPEGNPPSLQPYISFSFHQHTPDNKCRAKQHSRRFSSCQNLGAKLSRLANVNILITEELSSHNKKKKSEQQQLYAYSSYIPLSSQRLLGTHLSQGPAGRSFQDWSILREQRGIGCKIKLHSPARRQKEFPGP